MNSNLTVGEAIALVASISNVDAEKMTGFVIVTHLNDGMITITTDKGPDHREWARVMLALGMLAVSKDKDRDRYE